MVVITDCNKMFWGVTIDAGKRYSQVVNQGFHVSMAALEPDAKRKSENVQVLLRHESSEYLLCTLHNQLLQQSLDLNFATGEQVSFSLNGSGVVHLTGYLIPEDNEDYLQEFSESEEDVPSLVAASGDGKQIGSKRKAQPAAQKCKKIRLLSETLQDTDDDDDEDYEEDSEEEEGFSDDFEDDSDVNEEKMEEDIKRAEKSPKVNTPGSQKDKTPHQNRKPGKDAQSQKQSKLTETPQSGDKPASVQTPTSPANGESAKKKKKKKKNKKQKQNDVSDSQLINPATSPSNTPKTTESTPKKRVVAGGTIVEDVKVGHGPEAKPGKMVAVYYVGTLAKNNKRFDSCTEGKPFRFRLNQGEVIKGWDNGINGMKVGGKRRITVPANQGYGNIKQGPIPPNSTLVFEVELKAIS